MKKVLILPLAGLFILFACTESTTTTEEKQQIEVMDSTQKKVKTSTEELEDQTDKVEKSLEKLDKEFEDTTN